MGLLRNLGSGSGKAARRALQAFVHVLGMKQTNIVTALRTWSALVAHLLDLRGVLQVARPEGRSSPL